MSKSARRLGKGLDSLVSNLTQLRSPVGAERAPVRDLAVPSREDPTDSPETHVEMLPVASITANPFQPRSGDIDESAKDIVESIRNNGIIQPILVRRCGKGFEIIAGERRAAAARHIGMDRVPAIIRDATDEEMLELALVENIQREDLNAIDRATAYRRYCKRFGLTTDEVARRLGEDRTTVANYLRLLDLSSDLRDRVSQGRISMGHGRCLLGVHDEARRIELADSIERNGLSVRAVEQIVRSDKSLGSRVGHDETQSRDTRSPHLRQVEEAFEHALKTKVSIQEGKRKGRGRIVIEYYNLDDFDRIRAALGVDLE